MVSAQCRESGRGPERMAARKIFDRYKKEEKKDVRPVQIKIKETEGLKAIRDAWTKLMVKEEKGRHEIRDYIEIAADYLKDLDYTAEDVTMFSLALAEFTGIESFDGKAGIFLTALANAGKEEEYTIVTEHFERPLLDVGFCNIKRLVVIGDVAHGIGGYNKGHITVEGNAVRTIMLGATAGTGMEGGYLHIKGDADGRIGSFADAESTIRIDGKIGEIDKFCKAKVYHKGILIHGEEW